MLSEALYLCVMYSLLVLTTLTWVFFLQGAVARDRVPM
jgi:hypothetical protein